jgi:hypothetical protein
VSIALIALARIPEQGLERAFECSLFSQTASAVALRLGRSDRPLAGLTGKPQARAEEFQSTVRDTIG